MQHALSQSHRSHAGTRLLLGWTFWAYALYALYLLLETLDFMDLLHSKPPDFSPTYDVVHVAYFMVDMIVCGFLALSFLLLRLHRPAGIATGVISAGMAVFRAGLAYYLYRYTADHQIAPFIYKVGNPFSDLIRGLFVPAQILLSLAAAITAFWRRPEIGPSGEVAADRLPGAVDGQRDAGPLDIDEQGGVIR